MTESIETQVAELQAAIREENDGDELRVRTGDLILSQAFPEITVASITQTVGAYVIRGMDTMHQYSTLAPVPA